MKQLVLLVALGVTLGACNTSFNELQATYLPHDITRPLQMYPRAAGEACEHRLLFFIPLGDASVNEALLDLTKGSDKVDNLFGVQVESRWSFWLLGTSHCTKISAHPVVYKDSKVKLTPFELNMMQGRLVRTPPVSNGTAGSEAAADPLAPRGNVPDVPYVPPTRVETPVVPKNPTPPTNPTPVVVKIPDPPADPAPTQAECDGKCARFAGLWEGSDAIKATIRSGCLKKCMVKEKKEYRKCIDAAASVADISRCNAIE